MLKRGLIISLVVISLFSMLVIGFEKEDFFIEKSYYTDEPISGLLDIKFENDLAANKFKGEFSDGAVYVNEGKKLFDLVKELGINYTCNPLTCKDDYSLSNAVEDKTLSFTPGQEKLIGFKITGSDVEFQGISFLINVTNDQGCDIPLKIDFFDDELIDWKAENMTDDYTCNPSLGCFNPAASLTYATIAETPYCERVSLQPSNKFRVGANIKKGTTPWEEGLLKMSLYSIDKEGYVNWEDDCDLPEPPAGTNLVNCEIEDIEFEGTSFYVCIAAEDVTDYEIPIETESPICGFSSDDPEGYNGAYNTDFYTFAVTPKYLNIGRITDERFDDLDYAIEDYLLEKYDNNCSNGCVIPLRFSSGSNAQVNIKNVGLAYKPQAGGITVTEKKIYDAAKNPLKISTDEISIDLESLGVKVPGVPGEYDLRLLLGTSEIDSEEELTVEPIRAIRNLYPKIAVLSFPTEFTLLTEEGLSISKYNWNFGDGKTSETTTNKVTHEYNSSGVYTIRTTITVGTETITKDFNITVATAKESANYTITNYQAMLSNLDKKIVNFPTWSQDYIKRKINFANLTSQLLTLKQRYNTASSDQEYRSILSDISKFKFPESLEVTAQGTVPYVIKTQDINLAKLEEMGAGSGGNKDAIASWLGSNMDFTVDFRIITIEYDSDSTNENIAIVKFKMTPIQEQSTSIFILIGGNVEFKQDYGQQRLEGFYGLAYDSLQTREIEFVQYGAKSFNDVKVYVSPAFADVGFAGEEFEVYEPESPWGKAILYIFLILIAASGAAFGMWWWYKNRYESRLFKEKSQLYNLMAFIKTAKTQKLSSSEIYKKLKKEGWTGEQISYAYMQIEGSIWAKIFFRSAPWQF